MPDSAQERKTESSTHEHVRDFKEWWERAVSALLIILDQLRRRFTYLKKRIHFLNLGGLL